MTIQSHGVGSELAGSVSTPQEERQPGDDAAASHWRRMAVLASGAVLLLLPSVYYPFGRDQGVFAYVGAAILRGAVPYRDVWDLKPPGIYYSYAAMLACAGSTMAGVRLLDLIAAVVTISLFYGALRRLDGDPAAGLGALLYAALYLRLGYWGMAQAESYANLWTVVALVLWLKCCDPRVEGSGRVRRSGQWVSRSAFATGAAGALALLFKVTALPPLAAALIGVSFLRAREGEGRNELRRLAGLVVGLASVLAATTGLMALSGAGNAYLDIQRGFVRGYVAMSGRSSGAAEAGWHYLWRLYSVPLVLAALGLWVIRDRHRLVLGMWFAAALVSVAMQRKYFGYHWTTLLLPMAGLAGMGLAALLSPLRRLPGRRGWAIAAVGGILIAGWSVEREANGYSAACLLLTGRMRREAYWARFGRPYHGDFSFLADLWAASYIRGTTLPDDCAFIWGFEPLTLFLAKRRAPTRFIFDVPLVSRWTPSRWREELLVDLRTRPPALFGVMRHDAIPHASGRPDDSAAQLNRFPGLRQFLLRNYDYETTIEDLTLYRLRAVRRLRSSEDREGSTAFRRPDLQAGGR